MDRQQAVMDRQRAGDSGSTSDERRSAQPADHRRRRGRQGAVLVEAALVFPSSATGAPYGGFPSKRMSGGCTQHCIRFQWNPSTELMEYGSGAWNDAGACGVQVDSIGVHVETRHDFVTKAIRSDVTVGSHTVMRLEPLSTDQCGGQT